MRWMFGVGLVGCSGAPTMPTDPAESTTETVAPRAPIEAVVLEMLQTVEIDRARSLQTGDVNGDGDVDLAWLSDDGSIGGLRGVGDGTFEPWEWLPIESVQVMIGAPVDSVTGVQLADIDGDGFDEIVLTLSVEGTVQVGAAIGAGQWRTLVDDDVRIPAEQVPDLDGDGLPELAVFGQTGRILPSGGGSWDLGAEISSMQYPALTEQDGRLVCAVNFGFGISEIRTWDVGPDGLVPADGVGDFFAMQAILGEQGEVLLVDQDAVRRFDGVALQEVLTAPKTESFGFGLGGDLDGDGGLDLLWGGTVFAGPELTPLPYTGPDVSWLDALLLDVDGDGLDDLVQSSWDGDAQSYRIDVFRNVSAD